MSARMDMWRSMTDDDLQRCYLANKRLLARRPHDTTRRQRVAAMRREMALRCAITYRKGEAA